MAGMMLTDGEIASEIEAGRLKVSGLVQTKTRKISLDKNSTIQPSSLDLHIGKIYEPPTEKVKIVRNYFLENIEPEFSKGHRIGPGESVVVETLESIELHANLAAFGFPPAGLARNAILMTNPGHVDPGYIGHLSFTLINMGRESFLINQGDPIVSLLIFKFSSPVSADYASRRDGNIKPADYRQMLNMLSPDFGSYTARLGAAAELAVSNRTHDLDRAKLYIPAMAGAIATVIGAIVIFLSGLATDISDIVVKPDLDPIKNEISRLNTEIEKFRAIGDAVQLDERLDQLQTRLDELAKRQSSGSVDKSEN
jgi:dCTP deaminase